MTTIKQLSEDLGVSKQAIYNRITKEPLKTVLAGMEGALQTNAQGTIYLSDEGEQVIRNAYEEKYKRPGETQKQSVRPVGGVVATRVEFDDSKLDDILLQISNMQTSLQSLTQQILAKDTHIESLNTQLEERNLKNAELSRTAKKLTGLAAAREADLQALKDRCAKAESTAASLQQQVLDLENEIVIGDTNEPDPPTNNAYVHVQQRPIQTSEPPVSIPAPTPAPVLTPAPVPTPASITETEVIEEEFEEPVAEIPEPPQAIEPEPESFRPIEASPAKSLSAMLDLDLYEPLIKLSSDLSKPTSRLAGLVINE